MDALAEVKKVRVVGLAVLDGLVDGVKRLLGAAVGKRLPVVGQKSLRRVAAGKCLERIYVEYLLRKSLILLASKVEYFTLDITRGLAVK